MYYTFWPGKWRGSKTSKLLCMSIQSFFQLVIILVCSCSWLDRRRLLADTRGRFDLPLPLLTAEYLRKGFSDRQAAREFTETQQELSTQKSVKAPKPRQTLDHQNPESSLKLSECHLHVHITYLWFIYFLNLVHKVDSGLTPCNLLSHINPTYDDTFCLPLHASCLWQHLLFFSLHIYQGRSKLFVTLFLLQLFARNYHGYGKKESLPRCLCLVIKIMLL